jgi:GNAT superfamily N-acetyltransferase
MAPETITITRAEPTSEVGRRLIASSNAELKWMYVSPHERGSGIGRCLVSVLELVARALGVPRLVRETGVCLGKGLMKDERTPGVREPW